MGILKDDAQLLFEMKDSGTSFERVLMLGRQQRFFEAAELAEELRTRDWAKDGLEEFLRECPSDAFCETLFKLLGARQVESMDMSSYENASLRHDMNQPVSPELHERYDVVFDGGTLEHVFNFPQAIRNAMEMVKVGGSLVLVTPANNFFGHGFYQFSPELLYRVLSDRNGFQVENMVAIELSPAHAKYRVADPEKIRSRVEIRNAWPVLLFVHARRIRKTEIFNSAPQQADYVEAWNKGGSVEGRGSIKAQGWRAPVRRVVAKGVKRLGPGLVSLGASVWNLAFHPEYGFRNRRFFSRLK